MRAFVSRHGTLIAALGLLVAVPIIACGVAGATDAPAASASVNEDLAWGPAPAVFPPGAQMAVLSGDPTKSQAIFTIRLKLPNGYKIAPHTHPTDEHVTVIKGAFKVGMGTTFDEAKMQTLPTGGFVTAPAEHAHYAKAQGETIVQVHAMGPFALTYVNPADMPKAVSKR